MVQIAEFGNDFNSDFSFNNGDLVLIEDRENIVQSITNRLNTVDGFYDLYYNEYGGLLANYLGWRANNKTLSFMKIEITNILNQDPRFTKFEVDVKYNNNGNVAINIFLSYNDYSDLTLSLVINDEGIVENDTDGGD